MERLHQAGDRVALAAEALALTTLEIAETARARAVARVLAAGAITVAILMLLAAAEGGASAAAETGQAPAARSAAKDKFVEVGGYSITLPDGWKQTRRPPGSAFAASSSDGLASTILWIKRSPDMDLDAFEKRSKRTLWKLGNDVTVTSKVEGDSIEDSSVELSAVVPLGSDLISEDEEIISHYLVTLRGSGPFRYSLGTTIQPGAPEQAFADAAELSHSLRPWLSGE
jgi:hypothetical protein